MPPLTNWMCCFISRCFSWLNLYKWNPRVQLCPQTASLPIRCWKQDKISQLVIASSPIFHWFTFTFASLSFSNVTASAFFVIPKRDSFRVLSHFGHLEKQMLFVMLHWRNYCPQPVLRWWSVHSFTEFFLFQRNPAAALVCRGVRLEPSTSQLLQPVCLGGESWLAQRTRLCLHLQVRRTTEQTSTKR